VTERYTVEQAKLAAMHDHADLVRLALQLLNDLDELDLNTSESHNKRAELVRTIRTVLLKGNAIAEATLDYFMSLPGTELGWGKLHECNDAVCDWFGEVETLASVSGLRWVREYQLARLFWANRNGVLCALENLGKNARRHARPSRIILSAESRMLTQA